jgi:hypothetical protein
MDATRDLAKLIEKWAPELQAAFIDALAKIADSINLARLTAALQRGDVDAALREVNLDPLQFRDLDKTISDAYEDGGSSLAARLRPYENTVGHRLTVLFDGRNLRAERWIRNHSSTLVKEITEDQKVAIRQHLEAGIVTGTNPRTVALSLVGKINPQTGKREGGVIGLTSSMEGWARAYEEELKSGDRAFLRRAMRDRRFDASVLKAIKDGKPLSPDQIAKMVSAYRARALKYRADTIARTEAITALNQSQMEATQQAIDRGAVLPKYITKRWRSAADARVRHTHSVLNNKRVPFTGLFTSPSGAKLAYPGDPTAPPEERCNCRCELSINIDYIAMQLDAEGEAA